MLWFNGCLQAEAVEQQRWWQWYNASMRDCQGGNKIIYKLPLWCKAHSVRAGLMLWFPIWYKEEHLIINSLRESLANPISPNMGRLSEQKIANSYSLRENVCQDIELCWLSMHFLWCNPYFSSAMSTYFTRWGVIRKNNAICYIVKPQHAVWDWKDAISTICKELGCSQKFAFRLVHFLYAFRFFFLSIG